MTKESIDKVLKDIQESVPEALRKAVVIKTPASPTMRMVVNKALEDSEFPEEKKEKLRELDAIGYFDKERITEDQKVVKQINMYVNREIKRAVKEGRLPTKKQLAELQKQWNEQKQTS